MVGIVSFIHMHLPIKGYGMPFYMMEFLLDFQDFLDSGIAKQPIIYYDSEHDGEQYVAL